MKRPLLAPALAFALGLLFGVLLVLGPHPVTDSPWPAPTPTMAKLEHTVDMQTVKAACIEDVLVARIKCGCGVAP